MKTYQILFTVEAVCLLVCLYVVGYFQIRLEESEKKLDEMVRIAGPDWAQKFNTGGIMKFPQGHIYVGKDGVWIRRREYTEPISYDLTWTAFTDAVTPDPNAAQWTSNDTPAPTEKKTTDNTHGNATRR